MADERRRALIWRAVSSGAQNEPDKVSMEEQETVCRAYCERHGLDVVGTLNVPGLSRSESDIFDLFEEYASQGIFAYHDLRKMWKARAFDWLVCYVDERLGRSTSLYAHTIENVIRSGAKIASVINGMVIDEDNVEGFLAMGSYATSMDIKKLKKRRAMGMAARLGRGQKMSSRVPFGFVEVPDIRFKKPVLAPDPEYRRLFDDLATLLLEGVGFHRLEDELHARFGHPQYPHFKFRALLYSAAFWGHNAANYRNATSPNGQKAGPWIFDEAEPLPDGVRMERSTHAPVYSGDLAAAVKAELRRRMDLFGKSRPHNTAAFAGLLVCAECRYNLVVSYDNTGTYRSWRCDTRFSFAPQRQGTCTQTRHINEKVVRAHFHKVLKIILDTHDLGPFGGNDQSALVERKGAIIDEIAATERRMTRLVDAIKTVDADNPAWRLYTDEMRSLGDLLKIKRRALADTERQIANSDTADQYRAIEEIRALTLERFWKLPSQRINQLLRRVVGRYRLAVDEGKMDKVIVAPERTRRTRIRRRAV